MSATDIDSLRERLAEALHYGQGYDDWAVANADEREDALELADAVLPIADQALRTGQAEAWTDCVHEASALGWLFPAPARRMLDRNPYRAPGDGENR